MSSQHQQQQPSPIPSFSRLPPSNTFTPLINNIPSNPLLDPFKPQPQPQQSSPSPHKSPVINNNNNNNKHKQTLKITLTKPMGIVFTSPIPSSPLQISNLPSTGAAFRSQMLHIGDVLVGVSVGNNGEMVDVGDSGFDEGMRVLGGVREGEFVQLVFERDIGGVDDDGVGEMAAKKNKKSKRKKNEETSTYTSNSNTPIPAPGMSTNICDFFDSICSSTPSQSSLTKKTSDIFDSIKQNTTSCYKPSRTNSYSSDDDGDGNNDDYSYTSMSYDDYSDRDYTDNSDQSSISKYNKRNNKSKKYERINNTNNIDAINGYGSSSGVISNLPMILYNNLNNGYNHGGNKDERSTAENSQSVTSRDRPSVNPVIRSRENNNNSSSTFREKDKRTKVEVESSRAKDNLSVINENLSSSMVVYDSQTTGNDVNTNDDEFDTPNNTYNDSSSNNNNVIMTVETPAPSSNVIKTPNTNSNNINYLEEVTKILLQHEPSKLKLSSKLLVKFKGREEECLRRLVLRYANSASVNGSGGEGGSGKNNISVGDSFDIGGDHNNVVDDGGKEKTVLNNSVITATPPPALAAITSINHRDLTIDTLHGFDKLNNNNKNTNNIAVASEKVTNLDNDAPDGMIETMSDAEPLSFFTNIKNSLFNNVDSSSNLNSKYVVEIKDVRNVNVNEVDVAVDTDEDEDKEDDIDDEELLYNLPKSRMQVRPPTPPSSTSRDKQSSPLPSWDVNVNDNTKALQQDPPPSPYKPPLTLLHSSSLSSKPPLPPPPPPSPITPHLPSPQPSPHQTQDQEYVTKVSNLVNIVYGETNSIDHDDRIRVILNAYKGREGVLLGLLEVKRDSKLLMPVIASTLPATTQVQGGGLGGVGNKIPEVIVALSHSVSTISVGTAWQGGKERIKGEKSVVDSNGVFVRGSVSDEAEDYYVSNAMNGNNGGGGGGFDDVNVTKAPVNENRYFNVKSNSSIGVNDDPSVDNTSLTINTSSKSLGIIGGGGKTKKKSTRMKGLVGGLIGIIKSKSKGGGKKVAGVENKVL